MRVLHIGKFYPPVSGGMENFLGDLLPALQTAGVNAAALVHSHSPEQTGLIKNKNSVQIWQAPCYGTLIYAPLSPLFPFILRRIVRLFKPEILHLHMPNTSAFWALFHMPAKKIPSVIHWHSDVAVSNIDFRLNFAYRFYRPLESLLLERSSAIFVTSPPYLATSSALKPWKNKCIVVPLGINPARLKTASLELKNRMEKIWGGRKPRILAIGRLTYYKGHDVLIKAASKTPDAMVVIVGDGELRQHLQDLINASGLAGRVKLTGLMEQEQVCALLETCDFLCLSSVERTEAFGLVLLEAMRFGKPVIAGNITGSGIGCVVKHNKTGLLVRPDDPDALAAAIRIMSKNSELKNRMGNAAKEEFNKFYKINNIARQIAAVYDTVL
ncbi:hypothetical protein BuS5_03701 [Desulfosarcina sp. BuS5]|uniref:glycosyltransferase n=1 Tax=Desulfosarcina sp. BuS5 TaxID=933262 RepID=UPI00047F4DFC|nr:glycosyltransferase [Desulfosarcina sp. BuS5]WDN90730.1 hypothetical protein BuS5_03701 [Desulfosarcina sp. BuS5]